MSDMLFSSEILPLFSKIKTANINSAITEIINKNKSKLKKIKSSKNINTWESFVIAIEEMSIELSNAWAPVKHLNAVMSNDELRLVYEQSIQELIAYGLLIEQDLDLFNKYKNILKNNLLNLNSSQQILLENKVRDFRLSGVELDPDKKLEFKKLSSELSSLSTKFSNNVLDCTDEWVYHIKPNIPTNEQSKSVLQGIPKEIINIAFERSKKANKEGWLFGLDAPTYLAIMKGASDRNLRAAFHYAYATRASNHGPHDEKFNNEQNMFDILEKRYNLSKMLGYNNYAEYSLATKMVKNPEVVLDFLNNLVLKAKNYAEQEWQELKLFIKSHYSSDNIDTLKPWDISYYSELQKNNLFSLSEEDLKVYFPLTKVLPGFITIVNKLYDINLVVNTTADCWHPDVICYGVLQNTQDHKQEIIAYVYLDLYARSKKRNGAWMDECRVRCFTDNIKQIPVAYLTCNFTPPDNNGLALLTHTEVVTLFHEFGHCLHHLLTKVDYPSISGINGVPWDAVELPSQFHENWCWSATSLPIISGHYKTGEPLPEKLLKQLIKQKNYQAGLFLIRQLIFGLFDFRLHLEFHPENGVAQIQNILSEVRNQIGVLPYADYDQFQNSFTHIFAGGYGAGYYSYLWAEVLSANCFEKFTKLGVFNQQASLEFLDKILSRGGGIDINQAMLDFCGHEVRVEPLLQQHGMV